MLLNILKTPKDLQLSNDLKNQHTSPKVFILFSFFFIRFFPLYIVYTYVFVYSHSLYI